MTMTPEQASAFHETFGRLVSGVEQVLESAPVRDFARTAGREIGRSILRSVLGVLKR